MSKITCEVSKTEYQRKIRAHCTKCMGGCSIHIASCTSTQCDFYDIRNGTLTIDLFRDGDYKSTWTLDCEEIVKKLWRSEVYFSEVRMKCPEPPDFHWWNIITCIMQRYGYQKSDEHRRNPIPKCRGSEDYLWIKTTEGAN